MKEGRTSAVRRVSWIIAAAIVVFKITPAGASQYRASPPVAVSGLSPFADCMADEIEGNPIILDQEGEPFIAVDPTNPDHIVGTWIQDQRFSDGNGRGFGIATTFDGGASWETTVIPGSGLCTGGEFPYHSDPFLAFGSDGSLFHIGIPWSGALSGPVPEDAANVVAVNASSDGGLNWSDPIVLAESGYPDWGDDRPSLTVDPLDPRYVYATWNFRTLSGTGVTKFTRSTDGGVTWELPAQTVFVPGALKYPWGHRIHVLPDGTLLNAVYQSPHFAGDGWLVVQRSSDRGSTWAPTDSTALTLSVRIRGLTDPDDNISVLTLVGSGIDTAIDRDTGDLYAVWMDIRPDNVLRKAFFSMSVDAGVTWSEPIVVAQTPQRKGLRSQSFLPMVAVAGDGTVGVLYYDWRYDDSGSDTRTDVWLIHCHGRSADCSDRASWHGEARVTPSSFDLQETPIRDRYGTLSRFLGDYVGLAATEHDFLAFFTQPHDGDPGSIFFSRIGPVTVTATPTATPSLSATPTVTHTATPTATTTPTASATPSPSITATATTRPSDDGGGGCTVTPRHRTGTAWWLLVPALILVWAWRREGERRP